MRRLIPLVALATAATFAPVAHAAPDPIGFTCHFPVEPASSQRTEDLAYGGPFTLTDIAGPGVLSGSLTCTYQVGAPTHDGPDYASFTGPVTTGVVAAAEYVSFPTPHANDWAYECTQLNLTDGRTLYLHEPGDPATETTWTTDPGAACAIAPYYLGPEPVCFECEVCLAAVGALPPGVEPPAECPDP